MILILDEVDLLSDKDRNKDLLYLLVRSPANYMAVLLSNHPRFMNKLDESIRSSLQPEIIHFRNYDAEEIRQILEERARLGLHRFQPGKIGEIAALSTRASNSDVRVAIKTLYYSALGHDKSVAELLNRARRDLTRDILADLSDRNLLILRAAIDTPEPFVKAVYDGYGRLSLSLGEEPFSYVHFYGSLAYLQSIGLVLLVSTKVRRAYTNRVQLLFDLELLNAIWRSRFG